MDVLLVGSFCTIEVAGFYRLAKTLSGLLQNTLAMASSVTLQFILDSVKISVHATLELIKKLTIVTLAVLIPGLMVYGLFIDSLITLVYGSEFNGVVSILNIFVVGIALTAPLFWLQPLCLGLGLASQMYKFISLSQVITIVLMLVLVYLFGASGMAIATVCMWIIMSLLLGLSVYKKTKDELRIVRR